MQVARKIDDGLFFVFSLSRPTPLPQWERLFSFPFPRWERARVRGVYEYASEHKTVSAIPQAAKIYH